MDITGTGDIRYRQVVEDLADEELNETILSIECHCRGACCPECGSKAMYAPRHRHFHISDLEHRLEAMDPLAECFRKHPIRIRNLCAIATVPYAGQGYAQVSCHMVYECKECNKRVMFRSTRSMKCDRCGHEYRQGMPHFKILNPPEGGGVIKCPVNSLSIDDLRKMTRKFKTEPYYIGDTSTTTSGIVGDWCTNSDSSTSTWTTRST